MLTITTHVLDLPTGAPAAGVAVTLEVESDGRWESHGRAVTDADGRVREGFGALPSPGRYRLTFATGPWFASRGVTSFHPEVIVSFDVREAKHHHVPLLLSPFGFTTYRGS